MDSAAAFKCNDNWFESLLEVYTGRAGLVCESTMECTLRENVHWQRLGTLGSQYLVSITIEIA